MMINLLTAGAAIVVGVAAAILIRKVYVNSKNNKNISIIESLEKEYGPPTYIEALSFNELKKWVNANLKAGHTASILKITPEIFKEKNINLSNEEELRNYLLLTIMDNESKNISKSLLIKYKKIDDSLEKLLEENNGVVVIEA